MTKEALKATESNSFKMFDELQDNEDFIDAIRRFMCTKQPYEEDSTYLVRIAEINEFYEEFTSNDNITRLEDFIDRKRSM